MGFSPPQVARERKFAISTLIAFGGLPGSGKSSLARALALECGGLWLRIDTIEQAIRHASIYAGSVNDAGYLVAYAVAEDNLRFGRDVIADSVNPWPETRDAWQAVAVRSDAQFIEIEVLCSDPEEHRRRVETRQPDIPGLILPDWKDVIARDYRPWSRDHLTIDTANRSLADCVSQMKAAVAEVRTL